MIQRWQIKSFKLPKSLDELGIRIEGFFKVDSRQSTRVEPVSGSVTLILGVGSTWTFSSSAGDLIGTCAVLSSSNCLPQLVTNNDAGRCLEVSMPPWLASEFFSPEIASTPSPIAVATELGPRGRQLVDEVSNSPDIDSAACAAICYLCDKQIENARTTRPEILWAWQRLTSHSSATVESLANEIGWSERHFSKAYVNAIGSNPKRTLKLARFEHAYRMLHEHPGSLADVAVSAGYYDQSHMVRDFREFAGLTPKQLRDQEAQHQILDP